MIEAFILFSLLINSVSADEYTKLLAPILKESKEVPRKLGAVCPTCHDRMEISDSCPEFLDDWINNDKTDRLAGLLKSNFETCVNGLKGPLDFQTKKDFVKVMNKQLNGKIAPSVLQSLKNCNDSFIMGKGASTAIRFEKSQINILKQISFIDSVFPPSLDDKQYNCQNDIFPSVEDACKYLKEKCVSKYQFTDNQKKLSELTIKIEEQEKQLEKSINALKNDPDRKLKQERALELLKEAYPWAFGKDYKKARKHDNVLISLEKQFKTSRESLLFNLMDFKDSTDCFVSLHFSKRAQCRNRKLNDLLKNALPINELDSKGNKINAAWNLNMSAQACLSEMSESRDSAGDIIQNQLIYAGLGLTSMGLGAVAQLGRAAELGSTAFNVGRTAAAGTIMIDGFFMHQGVSTAWYECTKKGTTTLTTASKKQCPDFTLLGIKAEEENNCKLKLIMALASSTTPIVSGVKSIKTINKNAILKKLKFSLDKKSK